MKKIILKNYTDINDVDALKYFCEVMIQGRLSTKYKENDCYCCVTSFNDGKVVFADITKTGTDILTLQKGSSRMEE